MTDQGTGCARPVGKALGEAQDAAPQAEASESVQTQKEVIMQTARVGGKAPDFQAPAYYQGKFTTVKLSDFPNKWILVCFYPGDFTFV